MSSLLALSLQELLHNQTGLLLIAAPNTQTAEELHTALKFFNPDKPIETFPNWETLPYDNFSPHEDIVSTRLKLLAKLPQLTQGALIVAAPTLAYPLCPKTHLQKNSFVLDIKDQLDINALREQLTLSGYYAVSEVFSHGEFSIRGSIIDIFPMGNPFPYRIDLFDNEVESIRIFDPNTQRSHEKINRIELLPAREFSLDKDSITRFRENFRDTFTGDPTNSDVYQTITKGSVPAGIEYYLPLFFEKINHLTDYLPKNTQVVTIGNIQLDLVEFYQQVTKRYEQYGHNVARPLLKPEQLFLKPEQVFEQLKIFEKLRTPSIENKTLPDIRINTKLANPLLPLEHFLKESTDYRILFCVESAGRREALLGLLAPLKLELTTYPDWENFITGSSQQSVITAPLAQGIILPQQKLIIITETEIFGQPVVAQRQKKRSVDADTMVKSLAELNIGAFVVHIDHGIGRYLGLQTISVGDYDAEFLTLEYAGGDKLYVPVYSLHLISRYSGHDETEHLLNKLGTQNWQRAKQKAAEKVKDVAAELLDIYAKREARQGFAYPEPDSQYHAFSGSFLFEETPDQTQAIQSVIKDMTAIRPMDRLICGDVGFGKTEVALRAAFIAIHSGRQVAVLVPTTLLSQQHYDTFCDRFADWPVRIALLSRFRTALEREKDLIALAEGKVDIIIGTHALLSENVKFKDLGLVILDEEHRFGVKQKDKLKTLRAEVDILALTATPIPRTLNMAMHGIRDLSIIATPPKKRLAIKTFVSVENDELIREAILREIMRGGQVYYLHNNVQTIEKTVDKLRELVPEAQIQFAHGQMRERSLEKIMADFYHQRFNVLVCTTIIETGIDIPTANTIIIDRADKLGLAQLHQLRGRVGRSHHQAYAYLFAPDKKTITADAQKRLDAILAVEELGMGFTLATHDLEIRGAGEFLGEEQSGHMQAIGFSLYMELLERAVESLKNGETFEDLLLTKDSVTEINLQIPALIPEAYMPDVHGRLVFYKRISNADNEISLKELQVELIDRFGLLPQPVKNLFSITELKLIAHPMGIAKIDMNKKGGKVEFAKKVNIDPANIIKLIQSKPNVYKLEGAEKLKIIMDLPEDQDRIEFVQTLLNEF
ncbi:MAG: transcription-repair coupling factor [Legionellales bacterium]|jgi:transcription-repair coupling factor (superfamily II helicase)